MSFFFKKKKKKKKKTLFRIELDLKELPITKYE